MRGTRHTPPEATSDRPLHVLVVDDSAVVRQMMTSVLSQRQQLKVSVAADPIIAMEKMKRRRPDVILLDLMMPRMDGLTFLRKIMYEDPIPIVICSALTEKGSESAMRALDEGAVDVVGKPKVGVADFLEESAATLIDTVFAASTAKLRPAGIRNSRSARPAASASPAPSADRAPSEQVVAVGASTGGPAALRRLLYGLPPDAPGLVVVQHMPEIFTGALAERLDASSQLEVREAEHGDRLLRGRVLIAPGNRHMRVRRRGDHYRVELGEGPRVSRHRPSVDVLFESVARSVGHQAVGVLLTGMGADGADGLFQMRMAGAHCIAQDEASCVVFGMPKQAVARGAVHQILALQDIPGAIVQAVDKEPSPV